MLEPREVHLNSRALYRVNANRMMYGGQRLVLRDSTRRRGAVGGVGAGAEAGVPMLPATVEFETDAYRTRESAGEATLKRLREDATADTALSPTAIDPTDHTLHDLTNPIPRHDQSGAHDRRGQVRPRRRG